MITSELDAALAAAMRSERVLVACDFDGTLAPLGDDPSRSWPADAAADALRALATMTGVAVAIVSGRARHDLLERTGFGAPIHLIGSHGAEFEHERPPLPAAQQALLTGAADALERVAEQFAGAWVERKPVGVVIHYRTVEPHLVGDVVQRAIEQIGAAEGLQILSGSSVLEVVAVPEHKGHAIDRLRARCAVDAVVFVGDDRTDEHAFAVLRGHDVGVKVGIGPTAAGHRVDDVDDVCELLTGLVRVRADRATTSVVPR